MEKYYCADCDKFVEDEEMEQWFLGDVVWCPRCEAELVPAYECPIHGYYAPDGYGNCAKC